MCLFKIFHPEAFRRLDIIEDNDVVLFKTKREKVTKYLVVLTEGSCYNKENK